MRKLESTLEANKSQQDVTKKVDGNSEINHLTNQVAKAQKQISSQQTTGVMDQQ
ncbi:hypothetical protein ACFQI7_35850 [Paenibacillus allorhizosphaerae]|uniref:Uncharacterized protein n=1 Tax=Paenibacillus allorhizosphaerae TaxID=2849866 RepID=A0ABN7U084_9BACL|nr:hypothetical protein [Paenibacillus allorhizosphaerae]CAG7658593.1 hypothetical protein PAECIP111802_07087 [Paenibacillus allorhizosphaerae]